MGFIPTGDTSILTAYFTQKGREYLVNGNKTDLTAVYFSLGDSDRNYHNVYNLSEGFIPDVTGDNSGCVLSVANNVGIKYNVLYNNVVPTPKVQVMFQRTDNNQYYNTLDCLVHLDKISRYQLFYSAGNTSNTNRLKVDNSILSSLPILFNNVSLLTNPSLNPLTSDFAPNDDMVFEMLFDPNIYKKIDNTYIDTTSGNTINNTLSPIMMTFSSLNGTGTTSYFGAGPCSMGIYGREIGYLYKTSDSVDVWSFYSPANFEGKVNYQFYTDTNNTVLNQFNDFTIAAKINAKDDITGLNKTFIYRGDRNLTNLSDTNLQSFSNELKFSNQFGKLFADDYPVIDLVRTKPDTNTVKISGLVQKEVSNLRDFVHTSGIFNLVAGTNEYRTSKLSFSVYPKNVTGATPATLNIIFKYDEDELLNGDADFTSISSYGDTGFIEYDFNPTNGVFQNKAKNGVFQKTTCGSGFTGGQVTYIVPAGTYTGSTQSAADTLATNDLNTNGPTYANTNGTCTASVAYQSDVYSQYVQRNNCGSGYQGSSILVQYPQGQFTSNLSIADANYQATQAAQILANSNGTCTVIPTGGGTGCLIAGYKIIINEVGDSKNIEDLKIGDTVYSFHEKTLKAGTYKVENIFKVITDKIYKITTITNKVIECSPSHLFMVGFEQKKAYELTNEDNLLSIDNKSFVNEKIKTIELINKSTTVYNIEVEDAHTYLTENMIWNHNKLAPQP